MEKGLKIDLKIGAHSITPSILKLCEFYGI